MTIILENKKSQYGKPRKGSIINIETAVSCIEKWTYRVLLIKSNSYKCNKAS